MTYVSQFGWPGDDGLGERLIQQILSGEKTATCAPIATLTAAEIAEMHAAVGTIVAVVDHAGTVRAAIQMTAVYEGTFGAPPTTLLSGEGYPDDPAGFQAAHHEAWGAWLREQGLTLNADTRLLVEEFVLAAAI